VSGELRIIGGKARGLRIRSVPGETTRPITDRVREALFNIIGRDIEGSRFLDLFAGTGSVGIEALSRGASRVVFLDVNYQPIKTIRNNLRITGLEEGAYVLQSDAFSYLEKSVAEPFDYIFIAPPQYKGLWRRALLTIDFRPEWMSRDCWVIVQIHPIELADMSTADKLQNLTEFDRRQYGSTILIFYQKSSEV
jgi:16S rRNA (guanine(966)-N(2))-methyltransferase RsmD